MRLIFELIFAVVAVYAASYDQSHKFAITEAEARKRGLTPEKPEINKCPKGRCIDYFAGTLDECKYNTFSGTFLKNAAIKGLNKIPDFVTDAVVSDGDCNHACQCLTESKGSCKEIFQLILVQEVGFNCTGDDAQHCEDWADWYDPNPLPTVQCQCDKKFEQMQFLNANRPFGEFCLASGDPIFPFPFSSD